MDCHEFREYAVEMPRERAGQEPGNAWRDHAAECAACAAWLAAEEDLAASFDVLRERDGRLQASVEIEAALIERFGKQHPVGSTAEPSAVLTAARIRSSRQRWWIGAAAAALALAAWLGLGERTSGPPPENSTALAVPDVSEPAPPLPKTPRGHNSEASTGTAPTAAAKAIEQATARAPRLEGAPAPVESDRTVSPPSELPAAAAAERAVAEENRAAEQQREVVTEFVPLTYAGWASSAQGSRLVRVRLPSTALAYFGLPGAAATSSVEADVLLGEDGLAYAVRFVRPAQVSLSASDGADPRTLERY